MNSNYIIDPSDSIAELCDEKGSFLEDNYYLSMSHYEVPDSYWKKVEEAKQSDRRIVIIGSQDTPMMITKSAFMAYTLAKPEKITVKVPNADEAILLNEMFNQNKHYADCEYNVYHNKKQELASSGAWLRDIENATDVIIYGGLETISFFNMETVDKQNIYIHKPKFSFGIVTKDCLEDEDNLAGLAGDFLSFFGEGILAPKFYAILGKLENYQTEYIIDCMRNEEDLIKEYRSKLPLSKKSMIMIEKTFGDFIAQNVQNAHFDIINPFGPTLGDMRLLNIENEGQIKDFVSENASMISTIALEEDTMGDMVAGWNVDIPRYCDIGSMHFPYFYEPFDDINELEIYKNNVELT